MKVMKSQLLSCGALAALIAAASPASAANVAAAESAPAASAPLAGSVGALYNSYNIPPMWFRGGVQNPAAQELVSILRRSVVDGFTSGPALAAQAQAALAQAASGKKEDAAAAERALSASWVSYVQSLKRPTPGMIYAFPVLQPQGNRPDQILLAAAAAPSLEQHLASVASVNSIYSAIRDAEWARMQAAGTMTPDPRVVANLDRVRSLPGRGRFLLVDSATQRLFLYENGVPMDSMKVIVGMVKPHYLPTPMIASIMYYITYNPYWNAPDHLVREAIAPKTLAGGMKYFKGMGYEVMADWGENSATIPPESIDWKAVASGKLKVRIRQKPGKDNFMGILKFPFPNPQDIYLHDTPAKDKFNLASRDLSNGCVRVEDAKRLGRWLLGTDPVPPGSDPEIRVQASRGLPIYLTYITAQPKDGQLTFVKDIYGWDSPASPQVALVK